MDADLKKRLDTYRQQFPIAVKEEAVLETIRMSKKVYCEKECEKMLTYWEFLWSQLCILRKRWWLYGNYCRVVYHSGNS